MTPIRHVTRLERPGDYMSAPYQGQVFPGCRKIVGYLLCPKGCHGTIMVGDDQYAGKAPVKCINNHRFYFNAGQMLIELL